MQVQTWGRRASVQEISCDGMPKSQSMSRVYAQLVGAAGMRMKDNVNAAVTSDCCYFVSGYGFLTLLRVHFLSWSFVVVCTQ